MLARTASGATMLELSANQRAILADKLGDAANVAAGALVFSQFLSDRLLSPPLLLLGLALWIVFIVCGVTVAGRKPS